MILVDANILIYAFDADSPQHASARRCLDGRLNDTARVALASMEIARAQVRTWLASPAVWTPQPGERHGEILDAILAIPGVHGNLVMDAHLAALAIEHGLQVHSTDSDFARFPGLRWINPLIA